MFPVFGYHLLHDHNTLNDQVTPIVAMDISIKISQSLYYGEKLGNFKLFMKLSISVNRNMHRYVKNQDSNTV